MNSCSTERWTSSVDVKECRARIMRLRDTVGHRVNSALLGHEAGVAERRCCALGTQVLKLQAQRPRSPATSDGFDHLTPSRNSSEFGCGAITLDAV